MAHEQPGLVRNNPPIVACLVTGVSTAAVEWALVYLPGAVPAGVRAQLGALGIVLAAAIGGLVGKVTQGWTWPDWRVQEQFLSAEDALPDASDPAAAQRESSAASEAAEAYRRALNKPDVGEPPWEP